MRKHVFILLILLFSAASFGCTGRTEVEFPQDAEYNYLSQTGMVSCGDYSAYLGDDMHIRIISVNGIAFADDNAIEATMQKSIKLLGADDVSLYYSELGTAEHYGKGTGFRVYRFYPKTGEKKLVYKDTLVSNTDGFLGLEDMLSIDRLTTGYYMDQTARFLMIGNEAIPEYKLAEKLRTVAADTFPDMKLPDSQFRFVVSGGVCFFADSFGTLYRYGSKTGTIEKLPYENVYAFFTVRDKLYVASEYGSELAVLDLSGEKVGTVDMHGVPFIGGLVIDGEDIYLQAADFEIIRLDADLILTQTGLYLNDNRWTVKDGALRFFAESVVRVVDFGS